MQIFSLILIIIIIIINILFLCLVGTNIGEVMVWELGSRERLAHRSFKVWDLGACSMALQVCFFRFMVGRVSRIDVLFILKFNFLCTSIILVFL